MSSNTTVSSKVAGKLSAKKLAKKLSPETLDKLHQLEETEILHALIAEAFSSGSDGNPLTLCVGVVEREVAIHFRTPGGKPNIAYKEFEIKIDALASHAIPGVGQQFDELRRQFVKAFCRGASDHWHPRLQAMEADLPDKINFFNDEMVKAGFDRACDELKTKIIRKCYGGNKKRYQKIMKPAHRVTDEVFASFLNGIFEKALENHPCKEVLEAIPELHKIAQQLKRGDHKSSRLCWECNEIITDDSPKVCSSCLGARYCGSVCQIKAWKTGHRHTCKSIKEIHANHLKNHKIVKGALADPDQHKLKYGYMPNGRIDYLLLWHPFQCFDAKSDDGGWKTELPSMEHFYSNLADVKKGMLWSDRPGLVPDLNSANELKFDEGDGLSHVMRKGLALSKQYPEYSPGSSSIEAFECRNAQLYSNWLNGFTMFTDPMDPKSNPDGNCTAAEFLKAYVSWESPPSYERIYKGIADSHAYEMMRTFDKREGRRLLERKRTSRVIRKKTKVTSELHDRSLQLLRDEHSEAKRKREECEKQIVELRKEMVLGELKLCFLLANDLGLPQEDSTEGAIL